MKMDLAVVLLSGGMDSCLTAAIAVQKNDMAFLHINYGQRTEKRELRSFNDIANFYKVKQRLIIDMSYFSDIGGSSLTDVQIEISVANQDNTSIPTSYVPFRNANLLSAATSWAEVINAKKIFIGAVEEDSLGYPDCRKSFLNAFNKLIGQGIRPETKIEVIAPLLHFSKAEIVKKAVELKAPLNLTWSCYQDEDVACGICDSCLLRLKGFKMAGYEDPIPYRK